MSNQAGDIAQEAQAEFDALMHKALRVFCDLAAEMLAPRAGTRTKPSRTAEITLKI